MLQIFTYGLVCVCNISIPIQPIQRLHLSPPISVKVFLKKLLAFSPQVWLSHLICTTPHPPNPPPSPRPEVSVSQVTDSRRDGRRPPYAPAQWPCPRDGLRGATILLGRFSFVAPRSLVCAFSPLGKKRQRLPFHLKAQEHAGGHQRGWGEKKKKCRWDSISGVFEWSWWQSQGCRNRKWSFKKNILSSLFSRQIHCVWRNRIKLRCGCVGVIIVYHYS